ncbi:MAG: hypothetical protein AAFY99_08195 [Pseudomonadota bacterium]
MSDVKDVNDQGIELTDAQAKARKLRSVAIGVCLAAFVVLIYVGTWAKLGPALFIRQM